MPKSDFDSKKVLRVSDTISFRTRDATNPALADRMMQFRADYSTQKSLIPNRLKNHLMQGTLCYDQMPTKPMNKGGKSAVFGPLNDAQLGSMKDDPGPF